MRAERKATAEIRAASLRAARMSLQRAKAKIDEVLKMKTPDDAEIPLQFGETLDDIATSVRDAVEQAACASTCDDIDELLEEALENGD